MLGGPSKGDAEGVRVGRGEGLGPADLMVALASFVAVALFASFPLPMVMDRHVPGSLYDPLQHLWIMKWYRSCLLEGRSPLICPELQYPVGAPIGNFSPLHIQSLLFVPLSMLLGNDVLAFNLVWLAAVVTTGLGTALLAWQALRDRAAALFAGGLAMLSTPMMMHGLGHLELITLGGFPLFLAAWMRFVDRPTRGRLAGAAAAYVALGLSAAYFAVFAVVPALLYAAWPRGRGDTARGLRVRVLWPAAFVALVLPALVLAFAGHIWATLRGFSPGRTLAEFLTFGTEPWAYVTPTARHRLSALWRGDPYGGSILVHEQASYLGVVTLGLLVAAAVGRAKFARRGYLWACLAALIVLSLGGELKIGHARIPLPADWIKRYGLLFAMIRVPARFNLFASVIASVIAAAGLKATLARLPGRPHRAAALAVLALVALADLSVPMETHAIPGLPACYRAARDIDPGATLVEIPQEYSGGSELSTRATFWQSIHRLPTNAGYSGIPNVPMDDLVTWNSPFLAWKLSEPDYLAEPDWMTFADVIGGAAFGDYAWLYLHHHRFRYVVLHQWRGHGVDHPERLDRLKALLTPYRIFEDDRAAVYDSEAMPPPARPTLLLVEGWRRLDSRPNLWRPLRAAGKQARMIVYNPDRAPLTLALHGSAFRRPRTARLLRDGRELARWTIPGDFVFRTYRTPPMDLPRGMSSLTLECDSDDAPRYPAQQAGGSDDRPYSLRVAGLAVSSDPESAEPTTAMQASLPRPPARRR